MTSKINPTKTSFTILFLILSILVFSIFYGCKKELFTGVHINKNDIDSISPSTFLYNVPIVNDTIFLDNYYRTDLRFELEDFTIYKVEITIDNYPQIFDSTIINSKHLYLSEGVHSVQFLLRAVENNTKDTAMFIYENYKLRVVKDLSNRFIKNSIIDGRLALTWPELDKKNTHHYFIERRMGDNEQYIQEIEASDSVLIDKYYVGEEVDYYIFVINNNGGKQYCWHYTKVRENPPYYLEQDLEQGYNIYFNKCKYYNNFGETRIISGENYNPELYFSSEIISDTIFHDINGQFGKEVRYCIVYYPKEFPNGVSKNDYLLYRHWYYTRYGIPSIEYDGIVQINEQEFVFNYYGNIYKYNFINNTIVDSLKNSMEENSGWISATPSGKYIYCYSKDLPGSQLIFWDSNNFAGGIKYIFDTKYSGPYVSDNLVALKSDYISNYGNYYYCLYNIQNGYKFYTSSYKAYGAAMSPDNKYFLIENTYLELVTYKNNQFEKIWQEEQFNLYPSYYVFNPLNPNVFYLLDNNNNFITKSIIDGTTISSFHTDYEKIKNIDYYNNRIMGYNNGGEILIYNIIDGTLLKKIPGDVFSLFLYDNNTKLIGNYIYNNNGVKYKLNL